MAKGRNFCSGYHHAIELIGRRWTGSIIRALLQGDRRFSEVLAAVPDLSERLLSERLKELEREGIVRRRVIPEAPVRVEYALTPKGEALDRVVRAVADWARAWPRAAAEALGEQGEDQAEDAPERAADGDRGAAPGERRPARNAGIGDTGM